MSENVIRFPDESHALDTDPAGGEVAEEIVDAELADTAENATSRTAENGAEIHAEPPIASDRRSWGRSAGSAALAA